MYKLKPNQPDFECVDGPFAGRKFRAGHVYGEIPANDAHRFNSVAGSPPRQASPATPQEGKSVGQAFQPANTEGKKKKEVNDA